MDDLRSLAERSRALARTEEALPIRVRVCRPASLTAPSPTPPPAVVVSPTLCPARPPLAPLQRDLGQLYDDAMRLASADAPHHAGADAVPADVLNRAQRLLLSTGGYDVEAAARDAHQLHVNVSGGMGGGGAHRVCRPRVCRPRVCRPRVSPQHLTSATPRPPTTTRARS